MSSGSSILQRTIKTVIQVKEADTKGQRKQKERVAQEQFTISVVFVP